MGLKFFYAWWLAVAPAVETPIDTAWWQALSGEWKTILLINQNLSRQGVSIYALQEAYRNRSQSAGQAAISELNHSLYEFSEAEKFTLSYADLYRRALAGKRLVHNDRIQLATLGELDTLYLVNGPGDLSPLSKFPKLRVLILNYCGRGYDVPLKEQLLDLAPLRQLKALKVLHCSSSPLKSLEPIGHLLELEELLCDNTPITSLRPLKRLTKLKKLSVGSDGLRGADISHLENLEALYVKGGKPLAGIPRLKRLKKLCLSESEYALVDAGYRVTSLAFISELKGLELLDLRRSSYRGSLKALEGLASLRAVTLPLVKEGEVEAFKRSHPGCLIINSFELER